MAAEWTFLLLRASLLLSLSSLAVLLLTRWQPIYSPRWHRAAWALVLLQGTLLFPGFCRVSLPVWASNLLRVASRRQSFDLDDRAHRLPARSQRGWKTAHLEPRRHADDSGSISSTQPFAASGPSSLADGAVSPAEDVPSDTADEAPGPLDAVHLAGVSQQRGPASQAALASGTNTATVGVHGAEVGTRSLLTDAHSPAIAVASAQGDKQKPTAAARSPLGMRGVVGRRPHSTHLQQFPAGTGSSAPVHAAATVGKQERTTRAGFARLWLNTVLVVWLAGAAGLTVLLAANYVLLLCALRHCRPATAAWSGELERLCEELGIEGRVRLEVHTCLGPFLCRAPGGMRVVVPARLWAKLNQAERTAVLHHELCHLRRGDLWKALLARLVVNLHWFNPLAWLAARRFDESAEWSCDALMAREAPRRIAPLANALLAAARRAEVAACGALAASGGPVFRRIRKLLAGKTEVDRPMRKIHWFIVLAAVALLAALRPQLATLGEPAGAESAAAENPTAENPEADTPEPVTPDPENPEAENREGENPDAENREGENPEGENPEPEDPEGENKEPKNPEAETPSTVEQKEADELDTAEGDASTNLRQEAPVEQAGTESAEARGDTRLEEFGNRIITGDDENLQRFVQVLRTEAGRVVMADRAALAVQEAATQEDGPALWDAFVASRFDEHEGTLVVKDEHAEALAEFVDKVERGVAAIREMEGVFRQAAADLETSSDVAAMFKRFLLHEGSCASVYYHELRSSLHPDVPDIAGELEDMLVRTADGRYVVRPARRAVVAQRLAQADGLAEVLDRLHQELRAWADELVDDDMLPAQLKKALQSRSFAEYLALREVEDRSRIRDDDLEGIFWRLEEATDDVAAGLRLNQDSEAGRVFAEELHRFSTIWEQRDVLRDPLERLVELIDEQDELHHRFRQYLRTDTALMALAVEMDYVPRSAADAAQQWLAYRAAKNDAGRLELAVESPEQLAEELTNYFVELRELRRRGRRIDAFAARLADTRLKQSMQSYLGKLMLRDLMQQSTAPEEADGLQIWFDQHFEETPEGLVLREGAAEAIAELLQQAAEIEAQLQEADF